jgi:hypothetical protein
MIKVLLFVSLTMLSFMFFKVFDIYKQEEEIFLAAAELRVQQDLEETTPYHLSTRCDVRPEKIKFRIVNYADQIYEAEIRCARELLTISPVPFTMRAQAYRRGARLMYMMYNFDRT